MIELGNFIEIGQLIVVNDLDGFKEGTVGEHDKAKGSGVTDTAHPAAYLNVGLVHCVHGPVQGSDRSEFHGGYPFLFLDPAGTGGTFIYIDNMILYHVPGGNARGLLFFCKFCTVAGAVSEADGGIDNMSVSPDTGQASLSVQKIGIGQAI